MEPNVLLSHDFYSLKVSCGVGKVPVPPALNMALVRLFTAAGNLTDVAVIIGRVRSHVILVLNIVRDAGGCS